MDGGMLSQDEINALLSSMDLSGDSGTTETPVEEIPVQEASGGSTSDSSGYLTGASPVMNMQEAEQLLTEVEKDAVGEVANISMGASATTLYSLVNRKVNITTPVVTLTDWDSLMASRDQQCVFIQIRYTQGLDGSNILVLNERDVKIITDLMMGGDGTNIEGEIGELHLSAISEAMNQMMGSAATSLSTMLKTIIDISPPDSSLLDMTKDVKGEDIAPFLGGIFVKVSFKMQIGDLVDSTIMQLYPVELAKKLVETFISTQMGEIAEMGSEPASGYSTGTDSVNAGVGSMGMPDMSMNNMGMPDMSMNNMGMPDMGMNNMGMPGMGMNNMGMPGMGMNNMGMPGMGMNPMTMNNMGMSGMQQMNMQSVNVAPAQFQNFSGDINVLPGQENIGLIMDVPLEVTVELGRTSKSISEILSFAPGTIIELDRIAGEPIDVLVNGKYVAKGEVVVIEESFGIRVTEIIK